MKKRMGILSFLLLILGVIPCFAGYNRYGIPDSAIIRKKLINSWFTAPINELRGKNPEIHKNEAGINFQVRIEESASRVMIIVAPQKKLAVDVYAGSSKSASTVDVYPFDGAGSWVLTRDLDSGDPLSIKYYFAGDSDVFLEITASGAKALANFIIFESYGAQGVPLGIPFSRLYSASFSDVYKLTENTLPWVYTDVVPELYYPILQMVEVIRENLPRITLTEDACYDENGLPIYISTGKERIVSAQEIQDHRLSLSSAGFLKWVVDGLVAPVAGSNTILQPLLVPTVEPRVGSFMDTVEQEYDIYFSLNWTRNLAAAALSSFSGRNYYYNTSGCDVKTEPFASKIDENGALLHSVGYLDNTGYKISDIKSLLYVLTSIEPGRFYLGAVRQGDTSAENQPDLHFFTESVVIFPYFDTADRFNVVIFEDGKELSLETFMAKFRDSYVHLVRVNSSERFFPE